MAVLSNDDRARLWRGLTRRWSRLLESVPITKAELQAAVNAADDWADANAASFNTAIPQPARGALTAAQKALILAVVALARTDPAIARVVLGEVD